MSKPRYHYENFAEWKVDMDTVKSQPENDQLLQAVIRKIQNSSAEVQRQVQSFLEADALLEDPWLIFDRVLKENPKSILIVKTKHDPWFDA